MVVFWIFFIFLVFRLGYELINNCGFSIVSLGFKLRCKVCRGIGFFVIVLGRRFCRVVWFVV